MTHLQRFSDWLNALPDWRFTGTLYVLRWAIVLPLAWILSAGASSEDVFQSGANPWSLLIPFLVLAPVLETLIECTLVYWLIHGLLKKERRSPWPFVVFSALAMVALHPLTPRVITFAFITGAFLAYVYYHFVSQSHGKAILHTAVYHAGINIVGWTMIWWGS